jgi:hypothetical protein
MAGVRRVGRSEGDIDREQDRDDRERISRKSVDFVGGADRPCPYGP